MLSLPELLERCGDETDMLEVALFEVLQALDIYCGPLAEYWSWTPPGADLQKKMHHKNILLTIARQLSQAQKNESRKLLSFVRTWVETGVYRVIHTSAGIRWSGGCF